MLGAALLIIGVLFLLRNLGIISGIAWDIIWPVILIVFGLGLMLKKK